tara:strand:+ start:19 stop:207 length:189 start_codon:yes stop_codon:yes gene_type:complete
MVKFIEAQRELQIMYCWNEFHRGIKFQTNFNRSQMKTLQKEITLKKKEINELSPKRRKGVKR